MKTTTDTIYKLIQQKQNRINTVLRDIIPISYPPLLHHAIEHSLFGSCKRIRPFLVYTSFELFDTHLDKIDHLAAAVELIHTYSLIHDDLPAMDNDDLRRGQPTCHKKFGEDIAILAGDTLNTFTFELLSSTLPHHFTPLHCLEAIRYLSHATGGNGMAGGQVYDLYPIQKTPTFNHLKQTHHLKTGALITASVVIPAILGGASKTEKDALTQFGQHLGLLFQITDDILDVTSTQEVLGKTPHKDMLQEKTTYVSLLGLEKAQKLATEEATQAKDALHYFGTQQEPLIQLVDYIVSRKS